MVDTSLVGMVMNGLSHLNGVTTKAQFAVCLIRGLGGNLTDASRENLAKEVGSTVIFFRLSFYFGQMNETVDNSKMGTVESYLK